MAKHEENVVEGIVLQECACSTLVIKNVAFANPVHKVWFINGVDNVNWPPYRDSES